MFKCYFICFYYRAQGNLIAVIDLSEESDEKEYTVLKSKQEYSYFERKQDAQRNQAKYEAAIYDSEPPNNHFKAANLIQNHNKRNQFDTPSYSMLQIRMGQPALKKRKYGERVLHPKAPEATSLLKDLDDTDMFFLRMSRVTKRLPKTDQTHIKLALSNCVILAEIKNKQRLTSATPYPTTPISLKSETTICFSSAPAQRDDIKLFQQRITNPF